MATRLEGMSCWEDDIVGSSDRCFKYSQPSSSVDVCEDLDLKGNSKQLGEVKSVKIGGIRLVD